MDFTIQPRAADDESSDALLSTWLSLQCNMIPGVLNSVFYLASDFDKGNGPVAIWPEGSSSTPGLRQIASSALTKQHPMVNNKRSNEHVEIGCPILVKDQPFGTVAMEIEASTEQQQRGVIQLLQWGSTWLEFLLTQIDAEGSRPQEMVFELLASTLENETFFAASASTVAELASCMGCERVSLGYLNRQHIKLHTISNSADFDRKSNLVNRIERAMDEAMDQDSSVTYPNTTGGRDRISIAHGELSDSQSSGNICTVPLSGHGTLFGAITFERTHSEPFDKKDIELCEITCSLVGPILEMKRNEDQRIVRLITSSRYLLARLFGPKNIGLKLAAVCLFSILVFLGLANGDYRVSGRAFLEGTVQRVVVAPRDGFIESASVRPGDLVRKGEVLGRLDSKSLELEHLRWSGQRDQHMREYREAMALHDRAQTGILRAQVAQTEAQLELLNERLIRTEFTAPFDGVIVSGDLSQEFGSPVERGRVLFQVAPLDSYRVIIEIDETEISNVQVGQSGELALSALPGEILPIRVEKITPISTAQNRQNFFRVEARLDGPTEKLRPGMQGVGKIEIESRKLIWIWTHTLIDWLRFWVWTWWP